MATFLSLPILDFSIGPYNLNAYTYPAWTNLATLTVCTTMIAIFIKNLEEAKTQSATAKGPKFMYLSKAVFLGFAILTFNGILASSLGYAMPIVMYDIFGW